MSKQVPSQDEQRVIFAVLHALEPVPASHRLGFLFGMMVGLLKAQGFTHDGIRAEVAKGLDLAIEGLVMAHGKEPPKN